MRLNKRRRRTRMEMDMTPMIDVAFQLIIFFMTVSQMSNAQSEPLDLPNQAGIEDQRQATIIVNVLEDGSLRMNGEAATLADLIAMVGRELSAVGDDTSRLTVLVRADERGESRGVNAVVSALAKLRVTKINIAVDGG